MRAADPALGAKHPLFIIDKSNRKTPAAAEKSAATGVCIIITHLLLICTQFSDAADKTA